MKDTYAYPLSLLALFAILVAWGDSIFGYSYPEKKEVEIPEKVNYTYIPQYVYLSEHDPHFREAADRLGYDWTLIAAIAFSESRFDSTAVSEAGALGVMQVMPNTLRGFGIPDSMHMDPKTNIMAATELLMSLNRRYRYIRDPKERINFILASYNAGYGHIQDAMQLAKKYGKNRFIWNNSVDSFLVRKSMPEFYTDTVCRNGEFKGWRETLFFVKKVHRYWNKFAKMQQHYSDSISLVVAADSTKMIE